MKNQKTRKTILTVLTVCLMMIISVVSGAQAMTTDWDQLRIILRWTDREGNESETAAVPVYEEEGSFWAYVPAETLQGLILEVAHPMHPDWEFDPESGSRLEDV